MSDTNIVTLSVSSYNQIKAENYRLNLFLDNLFNEALIDKDHETLVFDTKKVNAAVMFCFPERYKKRLATLKTQNTRYGTHLATEEQEGTET